MDVKGCSPDKDCRLSRNFTSRLLDEGANDRMFRLFGMMDGRALARGDSAEHPEAPRICQHTDPEVILGFDPEKVPKSETLDTLFGLQVVGVDLSKLKPPPGESSDFGKRLQRQFVEKFTDAGLTVVSPDELQDIPGQPKLNIYFSFRGHEPDNRCDYVFSIFASLSQTVLLTRDIRVKVSAGVWSYSTGSTAKDHSGNEADAILRVADRFLADYRDANKK